MMFAESLNPDKQDYKYNSKELDKMHGLNHYDYSARHYDAARLQFTTMDPHAENYFSWSPYAYVANNPINIIDPDGMDWYKDKDGSYQYDPKLTKKDQSSLKEGQEYVGITAQINDSKGNLFASFRKDGSIMFTNEAGAYSRMVSNTNKTGKEEMGAITDNGVLVLPSYNNTSIKDKFTEYGYSSKNRNIVDALSGKELNTVAIAHTNPNGTEPTRFNGDGSFMAGNFPYKPNYILKTKEDLSGLSYIIANEIRPFSWQSGATGSLSNVPGMNINNLINGKVSLRQFTKQNQTVMINSIPKRK